MYYLLYCNTYILYYSIKVSADIAIYTSIYIYIYILVMVIGANTPYRVYATLLVLVVVRST